MKIKDRIVAFRISSVFDSLFMVILIVISLISKIFMYSDIKINANRDLLYSMLKPDTNSDSPSIKSRGARCVSAVIEASHINIKGAVRIIVDIY